MLNNSLKNSLKYMSLIVLIVQTTALVLILRYSQKQDVTVRYISSTAIVVSEIIKFITCIVVLLYNNSEYLF